MSADILRFRRILSHLLEDIRKAQEAPRDDRELATLKNCERLLERAERPLYEDGTA